MDKKDVIHTMHYYQSYKNGEILPFVKHEQTLRGIMLSEISQRKTNNECSQLYVES